MTRDGGSKKERAHELIDRLDAGQVSAVVSLLEFMLLDPVSRSLAAAEVEQEPISPEEGAALDQARAALDRGDAVAHEEVLREFGLSSR